MIFFNTLTFGHRKSYSKRLILNLNNGQVYFVTIFGHDEVSLIGIVNQKYRQNMAFSCYLPRVETRGY
jgi:hypothetical protein